MLIHFCKYQGTGNDFIILDNRKNVYHFTKEQVAFLCHRRFGIGADGLMLLNTHSQYDFEMKYYNADGGESSMCGNGGRCLIKFAAEIGIIKPEYHFLAIDGDHLGKIETDGTVALKMNDVSEVTAGTNSYVLNTGSPHYIQVTENVMDMNVFDGGRAIRYSDEFKADGINVNFVEKARDSSRIIVRTYERGVEDETYSCGTGVTAAALVCYQNENGYNYIDVQTKGGMLSVKFDKTENSYKNIWLVGPATRVFQGDVEVEMEANGDTLYNR